MIKARNAALGLSVIALLIGAGGCGGTMDQAERECPNAELLAENKCQTVGEAQQEKHDVQVEAEANEAEAVLKQRRANELANAAEGH